VVHRGLSLDPRSPTATTCARSEEEPRFLSEVLCVHQVNKNAKAGSFSYGAEDVFYYNIIPYAESLVRVTKGKLPAAVCS
jgi:hypothetical protein